MDRTKLRIFEELSEELARARLYRAERRATTIIIDEEDRTFRAYYSDGTQGPITEAEAEGCCKVVRCLLSSVGRIRERN